MTTNNQIYRKCVAIALFNDERKVFAAERSDTKNAWQMPQGGIDEGETIEQAALRELKEEIGTSNIEILEITSTPIRYDWPEELKIKYHDNKYTGQEQYWVAAKFKGSNDEIKLDAHEDIEFNNWEWTDFKTMPDKIVPFKRDVYKQVVKLFSKYT